MEENGEKGSGSQVQQPGGNSQEVTPAAAPEQSDFEKAFWNASQAERDEVMEILNPKEEQSLDSMDEDTVQYQQRKRPDDEKPKKRSRYSETETLFMIWANGSAPVGEVKRFFRFGKVHYYAKTEDGCVELSGAQYNERTDFNAQNIDRRAEREISQIANFNGSPERNAAGGINGDRNAGGTPAVSGQTIGEELRNDTRRSVSSIGRSNHGVAVTDPDDTQHQQRTNTLSNREVLELAASELQTADLTAAEKDALGIFQQRLAKLDAEARYNDVMDILNPKEEQSLDSMDEDTVQYQRKKNSDGDNYDMERIPNGSSEGHLSGLVRGENSESGKRDSSEASATEKWKALGTDKQGQMTYCM